MGEFASNLGTGLGGGRYTISRGSSGGSLGSLSGPGGLGTSVEKITRAGLSEDVLKRLRAKRPAVDMSGEADFRFGKPSRFQLTDPTVNAPQNPSVEVHFPDKEKPEEPPSGVIVLQYDEVARHEETIRVENPDDAEQYVMVKRALTVLMLGRDNGVYIALNFKYDD